MFNERTSLGLDVHARSVRAAAIDTLTGDLIERRLDADHCTIMQFVAELSAGHGPIQVTYKAGPIGFELASSLIQMGIKCQVAAPSKLLRPAGDRVKTDARDARPLVRLARNLDITAVRIPTRAEESARDLVRVRDDVRGELMSARHRLGKLLLRYAVVYPWQKAWTGPHDAWLRRVWREDLPRFGSETLAAFDDGYDAVTHALARRDRLDAQIVAVAAESESTEVVHRLGCLRGISTLTGFALAVEIGDWHRFTGSTIGTYLGLVPSEHSSRTSHSQGRINKTSNTARHRLNRHSDRQLNQALGIIARSRMTFDPVTRA